MASGRRSTGYNERLINAVIPTNLRDLRQSVGWTQEELARRAGTSQATVCRAELGRLEHVPLPDLMRMFDALEARLTIQVSTPLVAHDQRQRDLVHAQMAPYVSTRVAKEGWLIASEIEIHSTRAHGWIDALAFAPSTRTLLVDEIKTELIDVGALGRQLSWYEREAWTAARSRGWQPRRVVTVVFLLATAANEGRIRQNREALADLLPGRAPDVANLIATPSLVVPSRSLVLVDPLRRRRDWLLRSIVDGRRTPAPHADYADVARKLTARRTRR